MNHKIGILLLTFVGSLITMTTLFGIGFYRMQMLSEISLVSQKKILMKSFDSLIRSQVQTAVSILTTAQTRAAKGEITVDEAKKQGADLVRRLRFQKEGYFWIDTADGINVVLLGKQIEGKSRIELRDRNGVYIIRELIKQGLREGGGYSEYLFPKAGSETAVRKRSYTLGFKPWGWVVGTGYYMDEIENSIMEQQKSARRELTSNITFFAVSSAMVILSFFGIGLTIFYMMRIKELATQSAEEKIATLNSRLTLAADSAHMGVWDYSVPENMLVWDKWMYTLYGIGDKDFGDVYEAWQNCLRPDDKQRCDDAVGMALRGESTLDIEFRVVWPTGELRHIKAVAQVHRDAGGNPLRMIGVNYDITERITTTERVRESEGRLLAIFDLAAVGIARVKPTGEFIEANDHLCTLLGYPRPELLSMRSQELTHPDDLTASNSSVTKLLTGEIATYSLEKRYLRKSGTIIWGHITAALSHHDDPGARYLVVVVEDITQRKLLEQRLSQISREQRVILDSSSVGIAMIRRRRFGSINAAMTRIFGFSQEELTGRAAKEIYVDPVEHDRVGLEAYPLMMQGGEYQTDIRFRHLDGRSLWIHLTGRMINPEDPELGSVWIFEDITVRVALEQTHREDEARLRSSETRLTTIFRTSPDVIAISQRDTGRFLEVNKAFERIMGYRREEVLGRTALELGAWGSSELRDRMLDELDDQPRLENYTTRFRRKNGELFPVMLSLEQTELEGVACLIFCARDITEQERINEELLQARNIAQAANRAKSQFLANMSHEIRTPMNGVLGMAQLLAMTQLTAEQQTYVETLRSSGKNLLALISDILDLSKIEAGKMELEETDFDLRAEIRSTVKLLTIHAREKRLELLTPVDLQLPNRLRGDAGRLRQILNNLMGNALKFTSKGSVTLEIRKEREDDSTVALRFLIHDTGIGIPAEKLESIFAPFTQADGSTTRSYGGTGLGLTISRQLAELMGGSIGVESRPGKGSTFWFTAVLEKQTVIPCSPSPPRKGSSICSTVRGRLEMGKPGGGVTRLLLVEDEPINQMVITVTLEKFGFLVDLAENGREALTALENNDYTLVLMDCMMPVLNGFETTAAIRDENSAVRNHLIPVIALTANAFTDDQLLCRAAGMNDYLSKPVDFVELLKMIATWTSIERG